MKSPMAHPSRYACSLGQAARPAQWSDVEAEVHHVAVADLVLLAFRAQLAGFARAGLAAEAYVVAEGDGLGADEALLEIGVDDAGGFGRAGADGDGPGAGFLGSGGEVGLQPEKG